MLKEKLDKVEKLFVDVEFSEGQGLQSYCGEKEYLAQELNEKKRQAADELFST